MTQSADQLKCPKCAVVVVIDREAKPVRLEYDHEAWRKACLHKDADGLPTCPEMIDLVRELMERRSSNGHVGR